MDYFENNILKKILKLKLLVNLLNCQQQFNLYRILASKILVEAASLMN